MKTHLKCILIVSLLAGISSCTNEWDEQSSYGNALQVKVADVITSGSWDDATVRSVKADSIDLDGTPQGRVEIGDDWVISSYVADRYTSLAMDAKKAVTRGTPIHAANKLQTIGIAVYNSASGNLAATTALWKRAQAVNQNNTGSWSIPGEAIVWPDDNNKLSFLSFSPYPTVASGLTWASDGRTLDYLVPVAVGNQPDLCLGTPITNRTNVAGSGNHVITLSLKHALTAIGIKASASKVKIISATIKNIKTKGTLDLNTSAVSWSNVSTNGNRAAAVSESVESVEMKDITNANGYLMMIPQSLDDAAILELIFDDLSVIPVKRVTKTVRLNTLTPNSWVAGKQVFYNLQMKTQFSLTLNPTSINLESAQGSYSSGIDFTTNNPNLPVASANQGWISNIKVNANGKITFDYSENGGSNERTAVITVTSGLTTKTVSVKQSAKAEVLPQSNCYILAPSSGIVQIPVIRANADGVTRIAANDIIVAELLWQDTSGAIGTTASCIKSVKVIGIGSAGKIEVKAGDVQGNAVIAVKVNGVIRWSWHIWTTIVSSKTFNGKTWLDRNLGATSTATSTPGAIGLLYQWGRKDPFAGANSLTQNVAKPVYDASGKVVDYKCIDASSILSNFENAIKEPMSFFHTRYNSPPYQWSGTENGKRDDLWLATKKTVYDPCPEGYRVPSMNEIGTFTSSSFVYNSSLKGYVHSTLGYFPLGGSRNCWNGRVDFVGSSGYCWTTDVSDAGTYTDGRYLEYRSNGISWGIYTKTFGFPLRCIKE